MILDQWHAQFLSVCFHLSSLNDIRELTDTCFAELLNAVTGLLDRARVNGTAQVDMNSKGAAEFIKGVFLASAIINRNAGDVTASAGLVNSALDTIDSWRA